MMTRFMWIKRKPLATITICAIIMAASIMYWPKSQVAEVAIINPHPGLVGWWRFDEGTGTTAGDSSGNGNIGTISGASWVDGKFGKALSFDGTNDYVTVPYSSSLNSPKTFITWIKHASGTAFNFMFYHGFWQSGGGWEAYIDSSNYFQFFFKIIPDHMSSNLSMPIMFIYN